MKTEGNYNTIVYVDMDGVLADFDTGFFNIAGRTTAECSVNGDAELWNIISKFGKARFFSTLPLMPGALEMWQFIHQNFLQVKICTALGSSDAVDGLNTKGKRMWLQNHLPNLQDEDIIMVANKHKKRHYSRPGDIIIDDNVIVITEWIQKGGIGILHKYAPETIEKLKQYI
jgi:5'(3')-deoxyribonucleotidase